MQRLITRRCMQQNSSNINFQSANMRMCCRIKASLCLSCVFVIFITVIGKHTVIPFHRSKPSLQQHLRDRCLHLQDAYDPLLQNLFSHWNASGFDPDLLEHTSGERVYIIDGKVVLSDSTGWARTIPTFVRYIQHISTIVALPDMILPLNPADEPLAEMKESEDPRPLLAFCKVPGFSDVLIPNTAEGAPTKCEQKCSFTSDVHQKTCFDAGDVFKRSFSTRGDRKRLVSGQGDPRKASVVWRGTTGGFGGLSKGRHVLLQLGVDRPDLVDSGVSDWNEDIFGPHGGKLKPHMTMRDQVNKYKYQAWLPGNCASIRLALQLAADAAVFKVEHDDMEWYYPLLKPYVHYIPVTANVTHTDLVDKMDWAERHPNVVRNIVMSANQFARKFLSNTARDCYFIQLAHKFRQIMTGQPTLPTNFVLPPD